MPKFGDGDTSFLAAGEEAGVRALVDHFYDLMGSDESYSPIREMHPADNQTSRDKLARFLCGWLGGPRLYNEKYGQIIIPAAHAHLDIGDAEHDQWLACMHAAIDAQPYTNDFKQYLYDQLTFPAAAIRARSGATRKMRASIPVGETRNDG